jgi:hypothetical protein
LQTSTPNEGISLETWLNLTLSDFAEYQALTALSNHPLSEKEQRHPVQSIPN